MTLVGFSVASGSAGASWGSRSVDFDGLGTRRAAAVKRNLVFVFIGCKQVQLTFIMCNSTVSVYAYVNVYFGLLRFS